jgi:hypothetical protein
MFQLGDKGGMCTCLVKFYDSLQRQCYPYGRNHYIVSDLRALASRIIQHNPYMQANPFSRPHTQHIPRKLIPFHSQPRIK